MGNKSKFYANIEAMHSEVTGSCILTSVTFPDGNKLRFLVDCGLYQEKEYENLNGNLNVNAHELDFVLVTHNHVDHTGQLPLLVKKGYLGHIYMTEITSEIIQPALNDSYKVLKEKAEHENRPLIYSTEDVFNVMQQKKGVKYNETIQIGDNVKVTFFQNGHLIGAAVILVQISFKNKCGYMEYEDINLLFTGDYKKDNMFFEVEDIPEWVKELPITIIQESTYGDIESKDIKYEFEENIIEAIEMGKQVFIPAFSLGRFQEIMLILRRMQEKSQIPKTIPIYLDGHLAYLYTTLYSKNGFGIRKECRDFMPFNAMFVEDSFRKSLINNSEPKIIVSTSGMGSYGPARTYLPALISKKNVLIHFTGYTAEETLGRRVLECEIGEEVMIGGMLIKKRAEVKNTGEFSAHAKADEMVEFLKGFKKLKFVIINHGEEKTKYEFMSYIIQKINPKDIDVIDRHYFFRVNAYGFIKKIKTRK